MAYGDRDDWAALLPVIQAFVEGKRVQRVGLDGRWVDTTSMHQVLTGNKYRVRPDDVVQGVWTVDYIETVAGSVDGPIKRGTMTWAGSNHDTPPWKFDRYCQRVEGSENFTPD